MNTNKKPSERRYSSEEVADIIRLSMQSDNPDKGNSVDYEELLGIAKDVGVEPDQIDRAVRLLEEEQLTKEKEHMLWRRFNAHAVVFAAINLFLIIINVLTDSDYFWSMYVVFGWGLFLLGHYLGLRYAPQFVELAMQHTRRIGSNTYQNLLDSEDQVLFSTADSAGLSDTQGMVSLEDGKVVIEYQTADAMLGLLKTGIKVIEIPVEGIVSARLEQKLWSTDFVLQGKSMRSLGNVPGASRGAMRVKIARGSTGAANQLIDQINEAVKSSG
jgi:transposase-like protein